MYIVDEIRHYCNIYLPHGISEPRKTTLDYYDFTLVLEGQMIYCANNQRYVLSKNDAIFFSPGTHRLREVCNAPVRYVSFNFNAKPGISFPFHEYMPNCITPLIQKIVSTFPYCHLSSNLHSKEKCANILNLILYELMDAEKVASTNEHVHKIITYIDEHVCEKIDLATVSSYINLSKEYTSALFKNEMGITLIHYITKEKLSIARELILGSDMSLTDIASYVGFEDYNYFSSVFKKYFATSPQHMKQSKKQFRT